MIVTAHQLNYLPGCSVMSKVDRADAVIWLDRVHFTMGGWINRNRLPDGTYLTVPVDRDTARGPIGDVMIADYNGWNKKQARTLEQRYGREAHFHAGAPIIDTIRNAHRLHDQRLLTLNSRVMDGLCMAGEIQTRQFMQSELVADGRTISEKLADMVGLLGGDIYLSGPSGHKYLDYEPFRARKIRVEFHRHRGPNPTALHAILTRGALS